MIKFLLIQNTEETTAQVKLKWVKITEVMCFLWRYNTKNFSCIDMKLESRGDFAFFYELVIVFSSLWS